MTRLFIFLFLACVVGCHQAPHHDIVVTSDPELQRLTAALNAADSQTDMNIASKRISEFWDAKLAAVEKQISQKLDAKEQKQFADSKEQWHGYRTQEVQFARGVFDGGSIQPLVANESYSQITEQRVVEPGSVLADITE